jgi:hypothetical protein
MIEEKVKIKDKAKPSKNAKEYLNNREFTQAIADWIALNKGKERKTWTTMPNDIGNGIMKIITNFAMKGRWRGYTYIDDMRSDAFLTCLKYLHNFNIEKSNNAFAYVTQITKFAFRQFIDKENNQSAIRLKAVNEQSIYNYHNIHLDSSEDE